MKSPITFVILAFLAAFSVIAAPEAQDAAAQAPEADVPEAAEKAETPQEAPEPEVAAKAAEKNEEAIAAEPPKAQIDINAAALDAAKAAAEAAKQAAEAARIAAEAALRLAAPQVQETAAELPEAAEKMSDDTQLAAETSDTILEEKEDEKKSAPTDKEPSKILPKNDSLLNDPVLQRSERFMRYEKNLVFPISAGANSLTEEQIDEIVRAAQENDLDVTRPRALIYEGLMTFQDEEYEECIPILEAGLRLEPDFAAAWEALGFAHINIGNREKAFHLWHYFRKLMPEEWMPYNLLAQAYISTSEWEVVDKMFEKCLKYNPDLFDQKYWYAQNLLRLGREKEAEAIFRELIAREPGRLDIQIYLANILEYRFANAEACDIWRHINDELPGNHEFMLRQANLEFVLGELKRADDLCLTVLDEDPENKPAMTLRVSIAEVEDNSTDTIERLDALIDDTEDPIQRSELRLRLAFRCIKMSTKNPGLFTDRLILGIIRDAIDDNPLNVNAMTLYTERCVVAKRWFAARRWAQHILTNFNPNNIRAKDALFEVALAERKFADAKQIALDRFEKSDPTDPMRHRSLARIYMAQGEFAAALEEIDKMEAAAQRGTVLTLLYHGLTESDWLPMTSVRRLRAHINALKSAGFILISAADLPKYLALQEGESRLVNSPNAKRPPWSARMVDYLVWAITGKHRFTDEQLRGKISDAPMKKYFAVTFDDGLRSTFHLGDSVAREFGVPFTVFTPCAPEKEYVPSVAGWDAQLEFVKSGYWIIGSHIYEGHHDIYADAEEKDLRHALVNRAWRKDRGRLESMNEWDARMRDEFKLSREVLAHELGTNDCPVAMVAYPYGDIGQAETCNLSSLHNPTMSILAEAGRYFQVGFVECSPNGYTSVGDDLLRARRHEPKYDDEGEDVLRTVSEAHPIFMARRMRVELAIHLNRPHLARQMIADLERDGYPEYLCRQMQDEVARAFRGIPVQPERPLTGHENATAQNRDTEGEIPLPPAFDPFDEDAEAKFLMEEQKMLRTEGITQVQQKDRGDTSAEALEEEDMQGYDITPWFQPSDLYAGLFLTHAKAIDQIEYLQVGLRAGLNLNPQTSLSAEYSFMPIDHKFRSRWNNVTNDTKAVTYHHFQAEIDTGRVNYSHRFDTGTVLSLSLGLAQIKFEIEPEKNHIVDEDGDVILERRIGDAFTYDSDASIIVGSAGVFWHPRNDMAINIAFLHDITPIAVVCLQYDLFLLEWKWQPIDRLQLETETRYRFFSDDNAMFEIGSRFLWDIAPQAGVWVGGEAYVADTAEACDWYWTPYWDQRLNWILRYRRVHQGYTFDVDFLMGIQREDERPLRRSLDLGLSGASDWAYIWGVRGVVEYRINEHWEISADFTVSALRAYIDHQLNAYIRFIF